MRDLVHSGYTSDMTTINLINAERTPHDEVFSRALEAFDMQLESDGEKRRFGPPQQAADALSGALERARVRPTPTGIGRVARDFLKKFPVHEDQKAQLGRFNLTPYGTWCAGLLYTAWNVIMTEIVAR